MAVTLICPNLQCGKTMVADDAQRGKVMRCVHCQKPLLVPIRQEPQAPAGAAAPNTNKNGR